MQQKMTISFDFDETLAEWSPETGTICIPGTMQLLREYHALGCRCIILTARSIPEDAALGDIQSFIEKYNLQEIISKVVFTSHELKGPFAAANSVNLHYDDKPKQLESVRSFGIKCVEVQKDNHEFFEISRR